MTLKIVAGAVAAALALAGAAHAQTDSTDPSATPAQTTAPPDATAPPPPDSSVYAPPAQSDMSSAPAPTYTYDPQAQAAAPPADDADQGERWRRPERRGLARLLLPIDLVREGASAVRRSF